jgi:hypothetical protein
MACLLIILVVVILVVLLAVSLFIRTSVIKLMIRFFRRLWILVEWVKVEVMVVHLEWYISVHSLGCYSRERKRIGAGRS